MVAQLEKDLRSMAPSTRGLCYAMRPMVRMVKLGSAFLWLGLVSLGLAACSTDDTVAGPARGPKDLAIAKVEAPGSVVTESGGALELDCSAPMLVSIRDDDPTDDKLGGVFLLAPPGKCGTETNCGWIVVLASDAPLPSADGPAKAPPPTNVYKSQSAQSLIELDLPAALRTGTLWLRVELRDALGDPVMTEENKRLCNEFTVSLQLPAQGCH